MSSQELWAEGSRIVETVLHDDMCIFDSWQYKDRSLQELTVGI